MSEMRKGRLVTSEYCYAEFYDCCGTNDRNLSANKETQSPSKQLQT